MNINQPSITVARDGYFTSSVISKDGVRVGYRQYGQGPGLVLVQGAMGYADHYSTLAEALSDTFTVYVPDRRGRGMSQIPYPNDYSIQRDVDDLEALLMKTDTHNVYGLSSGALIALTTASRTSTIQKLAVYEPPLFTHHRMPTAEIARFNRAIANDDVAAALTAAGKAIEIVPMLKYIPGWLLNFFTNRALASEAKQPKGEEPTLREIAPTLQYDIRVVTEMHGALESWSTIQAEVLLLGGGKSPSYLKTDLDALERVLSHVTRVTFPELGHAGSWNYDRQRNPTGNPEAVAQVLRRFFVARDI